MAPNMVGSVTPYALQAPGRRFERMAGWIVGPLIKGTPATPPWSDGLTPESLRVTSVSRFFVKGHGDRGRWVVRVLEVVAASSDVVHSAAHPIQGRE